MESKMFSNRKCLIFAFVAIYNVYSTSCQYFVDPKAVFVDSFDGWGTSLCWWPEVLGNMDENIIQNITRSFFSPTELNLNIVRYTIGGTTPWNYTCGPYRDGGATETFRDGIEYSYDWTRDVNQRRILQMAKELGVNIFEAFSNSPPQWMTISGCSKGNDLGAPLYVNFLPEQADLFTDYATEVLLYFQNYWNITFDYYVPFNEPYGDDGNGWWYGTNQRQEGCHMERSTMAAVIRSLSNALQRKNLTMVKISVADETQINTEVATQEYFHEQQGLSTLYNKINTHGYWDNGERRRDYLHMLAQRAGHKLWMDEVGWQSSPANDMTAALNIANRIVWDLRDMVPDAWVYWQSMEDAGAWGLIEIPYRNASLENISFRSGFFAMKQFSKFIKRGYSIIHVNDLNSVSAFDKANNVLVLVIVNPDDFQTISTYDLTQFQALGNVSATRTSSSEQSISITAPAIDSFHLPYTAPSRSITTIVIENAIPYERSNIIQNGDFETGSPFPWALFFGSSGGASRNYAWNGNFSGFITTNSTHDVSLNQRVIANRNGTYHLTARCASNGDSAKFGLKVNDIQGPEVNIAKNAGYKVYGLSFQANENDFIDIYLYAGKDNSDSYIDDVILH